MILSAYLIVISRLIDYTTGFPVISVLGPAIEHLPRLFGRKSLDTTTRSNVDEELISDETGAAKKSSDEDLMRINRILAKKANDYYGILELNRGATEKEINRAFNRLALCVHPDKTCAPQANHATQRLVKARDELLKMLEKSNSKDNLPTTAVEEADDLSSTIPPESENDAMKANSSGNKSHYILIIFGIIAIGTITAVVCFIKQRHRLSPSANRNHSSKSKRGGASTGGSPRSHDHQPNNRDSSASSSGMAD